MKNRYEIAHTSAALRWRVLVVAVVAALALAGGLSTLTRAAADVPVSIVEPNYDNTDTWTFEPNAPRIKVGDTVVWTNKGADPHDVTSDDKSFVSGPEGNLNPGDVFKFTFTKAGTFGYICAAHPWMRGSIVVE